MAYHHTVAGERFAFADLRTLLARASPARSGDQLAGVAAQSSRERVAAQAALAELPLARFLDEAVVPYEDDEVTRLIIDRHDAAAFAPVRHFCVGDFRDWLLGDAADGPALAALAPGLTPEMVAAASKLMRVQDLVLVPRKCRVVTRFRGTLGLPGRLATRLQPNHPTDDASGIAASLLDGLLHGSGDAVIGINPATDRLPQVVRLLQLLDAVIRRHGIPTQSCVLTHVTQTLRAIEQGAPVDLVFQSIAGTEGANKGFGIDLALLAEARAAALALQRGACFDDGKRGANVMYFETGQGSALSAGAHHGCDQQTLEARAYAVARAFEPLLVNSVVGFIGPEYLFDGKQILRAGLEDHCCAKLLGLPMGCDVCYTNHAEADADDMDALLTLLGAAGCNFVMGVPGADDIMLGYQSTSFHDALYVRRALGLRPAPEFEGWLERMGIARVGEPGRLRALPPLPLGEGGGEGPAGTAPHPTSPQRGEEPDRIAPQRGEKQYVTMPWHSLRRYTAARIAQGRAGASLPSGAQLEFRLDHARARDAVHLPFDPGVLRAELEALSWPALVLHSAAADRAVFLQRPDLGRRLDEDSRSRLAALQAAGGAPPRHDLALVVADDLSALAVHRHAVPLLAALRQALPPADWRLAPVALVQQGRVAIGDEIGAALGAELVVVLIGERPGLSSPDSLGLYLSFAPRVGMLDAERNCISNVRPEGLAIAAAAAQLRRLLEEARRRRISGVALKDDADDEPSLQSAAFPEFLLGAPATPSP